ncbi:transglutaminase domain-containing protein [Eisenbergiella sp.]
MKASETSAMLSPALREYAERRFRERKEIYAPIFSEIEDGLCGCTEEEAVLMRFLYGTMPVRDAGEYGFHIFLSYVRHTLWLRENVEWCSKLPEDIFVHYVLYYRINTEDISDCRPFFYGLLKDRIAGLTLEEAVREINYWCAEHAAYEATDGRTASPKTLYRCGKGRCGEESAFAAAVYRSMGIAARQVYAPRWAHCDDNHAWVEVYIHGRWHFLGACEPEEELDRGWFSGPASRAVLIHSRCFCDYDCGGMQAEWIGREDGVYYLNETAAYAKTCRLTIAVKDTLGKPVKGARAAIEILNMSEFFPAATLVTDENGEAAITMGIGDVRLRAWSGGKMCEKMIFLTREAGGRDGGLEENQAKVNWIKANQSKVNQTKANQSKEIRAELVLKSGYPLIPEGNIAGQQTERESAWEQALLRAPAAPTAFTACQPKEQKERRQRRLEEAVRLREERFRTISAQLPAGDFPEEKEMLEVTGENAAQLYAFLKKDGNPDRKRLLHSLARKDYKDASAAVLEDHLDCINHLNCIKGDLTEDIYVPYLLCPRIYLEELTPYRSFIRSFFSEKEKAAFIRRPELIWEYIEKNIRYDPQLDYSAVCGTPIGCLKLKWGSLLSRKILFAAICRSLGIPARLRRSTMQPEYLENGEFQAPAGLQEKDRLGRHPEPAALILQASEGKRGKKSEGQRGDKWNYGQNWSIGKLEGAGFSTLGYEGLCFEGDSLTLGLEAGVYRLVTSRRLPDGSQQAAWSVFTLQAGEQRTEVLILGENSEEAMLSEYPGTDLPELFVWDTSGERQSLTRIAGCGMALAAFLGTGEEPTEHVLNELIECATQWNGSGAEIIMILRRPEELKNATLQKALKRLDRVRIYFDKEEAAEKTAVKMGADPEKLPLLVLTEEGRRGIYACAGYHVGSVDLLLKILMGVSGSFTGLMSEKTDRKEENDDNIDRKAE